MVLVHISNTFFKIINEITCYKNKSSYLELIYPLNPSKIFLSQEIVGMQPARTSKYGKCKGRVGSEDVQLVTSR